MIWKSHNLELDFCKKEENYKLWLDSENKLIFNSVHQDSLKPMRLYLLNDKGDKLDVSFSNLFLNKYVKAFNNDQKYESVQVRYNEITILESEFGYDLYDIYVNGGFFKSCVQEDVNFIKESLSGFYFDITPNNVFTEFDQLK